jgi:ABC-type phosphate transport system substrate-binding protein
VRRAGKGPYVIHVRQRNKRGVFVDTTSLLVLGGGTSAPAAAYVGLGPAGVNPATSPTAGSILGYFASHATLPIYAGGATSWALSYCQTENYAANYDLSVLDGAAPQPNPCPVRGHFFVPGRNAYDAAGQTDTADFSASDLPVAQSEFSTTASNYPYLGQVVQVPYLAGSVAIVYNNSDAPLGTLSLTAAQVCGIFDGEITNWNQIPRNNQLAAISTSNPGFPQKTIKLVYRVDPNGTTFSLTNWLSAAVAGGNGVHIPLHCTAPGETWGLNPDFVSALPEPPGASILPFASFGEQGMMATVNGQDGAIGYVSGAYYNDYGLLSGSSTYFNVSAAPVYLVNATGYARDPVLDLPQAAEYINTLKKDMTVVYTCGANYPGCTTIGRPIPDLVPLVGAYRSGCVAVVDPASYQSPPLGYPILSVSNLELYSSGNGIYAPGLQFLGGFLSNGASPQNINGTTVFGQGGLTTIDQATTIASTGTTGFSSLGISHLFYIDPTIGLLPQCVN